MENKTKTKLENLNKKQLIDLVNQKEEQINNLCNLFNSSILNMNYELNLYGIALRKELRDKCIDCEIKQDNKCDLLLSNMCLHNLVKQSLERAQQIIDLKE